MSEAKDIPDLPADSSAERLVYKQPQVLSVTEIAEFHPVFDELFFAEAKVVEDLTLLGEKSPETHAHSVNVAQLGIALAVFMGYERSLQRAIARAGLLHDIGKVLDQAVLTLVHSTQPLDDTERRIVNRHTQLGYDHLIVRDPFSAVIAGLHHKPIDEYSATNMQPVPPHMESFVNLSAITDVVSASIDPRIYRLRPLATSVIKGRINEKLPGYEKVVDHALSVYTSPDFRKATS